MAELDLHAQPVAIRLADNSSFSVSLLEFNLAISDAVRLCVVFATQLGACGVLLILLAVLTPQAKRRTILFWVNMFALALVCVRSILQILFFLSPWYDMFNYMACNWTSVPMGDRYTSATASCCALVLVLTVELSLILQVRVVFKNVPKVAFVLTIFTALLGATAVGLYAAAAVRSSIVILQAGTYIGDGVYAMATSVFCASICACSAIFVTKLGYAIRRRRALGLQKFGPLQIVFIMGCQTMVLPGVLSSLREDSFLLIREAIFTIIERFVSFDGMGSLAATSVAISLPLSSMWAAADTSGSKAPLAIGYRSSRSTIAASTTASTGNNLDGRRHCEGVKVERAFDVESSKVCD